VKAAKAVERNRKRNCVCDETEEERETAHL
jgi:hypothetical protein